jgi:hypothetical protein
MDPIEPMIASGSKTMGMLPRYHWAPDGKSILITQGGKLRRVDVATREVATIPFSARVQRTISEMARKEFRITDDAVQTKFFRWPTATADGKTRSRARVIFHRVRDIHRLQPRNIYNPRARFKGARFMPRLPGGESAGTRIFPRD